MPKEKKLDLRKPSLRERIERDVVVERDRTDPYSIAWAKIVWPITRAILLLVSAVMLLPFVFLVWLDPQVKIEVPAGTPPDQVAAAVRTVAEAQIAQQRENMLDWAKTVLPSVVGFASAMIGYYFGTRSGQSRPQEISRKARLAILTWLRSRAFPLLPKRPRRPWTASYRTRDRRAEVPR